MHPPPSLGLSIPARCLMSALPAGRAGVLFGSHFRPFAGDFELSPSASLPGAPTRAPAEQKYYWTHHLKTEIVAFAKSDLAGKS